MKFIFLGYDYTLDIAHKIMANGHELVHIFTFPCDNMFAFNTEIQAFAVQESIPITEERIKSDHINTLVNDGVTLLLCAGYPYKVPVDDIVVSSLCALNVHPALLPRARGVMPLPYVIMHEPEAAGFTVHKMSATFDAGDIVYQESIPCNKDMDIETLSAAIALRMPAAIGRIIDRLDHYVDHAKPQNVGQSSSYPMPTAALRTLDFGKSLDDLLHLGRAFGRFGVLATIYNNVGQFQQLAVFQFSGWRESHNHDVGMLMRSSPREIIVTISDGYLCIKDFQIQE